MELEERYNNAVSIFIRLGECEEQVFPLPLIDHTPRQYNIFRMARNGYSEFVSQQAVLRDINYLLHQTVQWDITLTSECYNYVVIGFEHQIREDGMFYYASNDGITRIFFSILDGF